MGKQYDYNNQAWYDDVTCTYIRCNHSQKLDCACYGKVHAGEILEDIAAIQYQVGRGNTHETMVK